MGPAGCAHFPECYPVSTTIPAHLFSTGPCSPIVFPLPAQVLTEDAGMKLAFQMQPHPIRLLVSPPGVFPASLLVENLAALC